MFADDTNLFYSHKNIKALFQIVNSELKLANEWFSMVLFDSVPLQLQIMTFNNIEIKRESSLKFT